MSKSVLDFLKGKNVFVFDTETTGLPLGSPSGWGSYWDYRMNDKYDSSRIVSIAWASINNFDRENIDNSNNVRLLSNQLGYKREIGFTNVVQDGVFEINL